ncbi:MAG: HlyD family efflux transporter periplasmic adaptor subunit [Anaerovoracaceae bacterium]|jgi:hypothetical protein
MPKLTKKTIFIYLLIVVILYLVIGVIPSVTGALTSTETVKEGTVRVEDDVRCYVVRDDTVCAAARDSSLSDCTREGTLVRQGTAVIAIADASLSKDEKNEEASVREIAGHLGSTMQSAADGSSPRRGTFSHYADGAESYFSPSRLDRITENGAAEHQWNSVNLQRSKAAAGTPIFKISDTADWYMVCWVKESRVAYYEKGVSVSVRLPHGTISAVVDRVSKEKRRWKVVLHSRQYYRGLTRLRSCDAKLIALDERGLVVSNKCLTQRKGRTGVYVRSVTGDYVFTPVQVLGTDGKKTVIAEGAYVDAHGRSVNTVNMYDEVLRHPKSEKSAGGSDDH